MKNQNYVAQYNEEVKRWEIIALARTVDEASHIMDWESRFSGWNGSFSCGTGHEGDWGKVMGQQLHFDQSTVDERERQRYETRYPKLPKVQVTSQHVWNQNADVVGEEEANGYEDGELCAAIATFATEPALQPITVAMVAIELVRGWDNRKDAQK